MDERGPSRNRRAGSQSSSEKPDFEQLMDGTGARLSDEQDARITQHLISGEQSYDTQPHRPPLNAQNSPAEKYAAQVSQKDDDVSERPTSYRPGLFQN